MCMVFLFVIPSSHPVLEVTEHYFGKCVCVCVCAVCACACMCTCMRLSMVQCCGNYSLQIIKYNCHYLAT